MRQRVISTVVLWATLLGLLALTDIVGGVLLLTVVAGLAQWEFYKLLRRAYNMEPNEPLGLAAGSLLVLGCFIPSNDGLDAFLIVILAIGFLGFYRDFAKEVAPTLLGIIFIPFLLQFYGVMAQKYETFWVAVWVIGIAKFADVGGLLIGKWAGLYKLSPRISPNKTWEGAGGGILFGMLFGWLLFLFAKRHIGGIFAQLHTGEVLLFGAVLAAVSIFSDLLESYFKREAGVKDSGHTIPGIGGTYDLVDSMILCAPVAFLLLKYATHEPA